MRLTSRLCKEKESGKEKARQEHLAERMVVARERGGRWNPSGVRELFILHNGPSAIVRTNKGQLASEKGKSRGGQPTTT